MKANYKRDEYAKKDYNDLPEWQRQRLSDWVKDEASERVRQQEALVQKRWLMMEAIILHEIYGFGEDRCIKMLVAWKQMYSRAKQLADDKTLEQYLKDETDKIFKNGYPEKWIDSMEEQTT